MRTVLGKVAESRAKVQHDGMFHFHSGRREGEEESCFDLFRTFNKLVGVDDERMKETRDKESRNCGKGRREWKKREKR